MSRAIPSLEGIVAGRLVAATGPGDAAFRRRLIIAGSPTSSVRIASSVRLHKREGGRAALRFLVVLAQLASSSELGRVNDGPNFDHRSKNSPFVEYSEKRRK